MAANLVYPTVVNPIRKGYHVWTEDIPVFDYGTADPKFDWDRAVNVINVATIEPSRADVTEHVWRCQGLSGFTLDQRSFCEADDLTKYIVQMRKRGFAVQPHTVPAGFLVDQQIEMTTDVLNAMRAAGVPPRIDLNYEPGFYNAHIPGSGSPGSSGDPATRLPLIQGIRAANPDAWICVTFDPNHPENYVGIWHDYVDAVFMGLNVSHLSSNEDEPLSFIDDAIEDLLVGSDTYAPGKERFVMVDPWEPDPTRMDYIMRQCVRYFGHEYIYIWRRGVIDGDAVSTGPWDSWPNMRDVSEMQVRYA